VPDAVGVVVRGDHARIERRARGGWIGDRGGLSLRALDEVIPAAEALATAGQQQHVDARIEVRLLHAALQLGDQLPGDPGPAPRPPTSYSTALTRAAPGR